MKKRSWRRTPRSQRILPQEERPAPSAPQKALPGFLREGRPGAILLLALAMLFMVRFLTDARFRVAQIRLQRGSLVSEEQLLPYVNVTGKPIFLVNTRRIEKQLQKAYGCFESVRVTARLPDRLEIRIQERPAAFVWEREGSYWWVDAKGLVLGAAPERGHLPVIHDRSQLPIHPGEYLVGVPWAFVMDISRAMPEAKDFHYTLEDGLILITPEGWPVYLGTQGVAKEKAILLEKLREILRLRGQHAVYIDLKNEQRPVAKVETG